MKTIWAQRTTILLVLLVVCIWHIYEHHEIQDALLLENQALREEITHLQNQLAATGSKVEELEKKSLEGMLEETNKVIVSGWQTLLDTVEKELEKAKSAIGSPENESATPEAESPLEKQNNPPVYGERT